jgi:arylsulfatase A-like enzyme
MATHSPTGRVLSALRSHNIEEKTIVIFLNDNGGKKDLDRLVVAFRADITSF